MKQVHSKLIGTTDATYATVDNYRWVVYKVHESGTTSYEYLPSDKSSTGTAGINLSYIMKTYFGDPVKMTSSIVFPVRKITIIYLFISLQKGRLVTIITWQK